MYDYVIFGDVIDVGEMMNTIMISYFCHGATIELLLN